MRYLLPVILSLSFLNAFSQVVTIPDSSFKYNLLIDPIINTNFDSEIQLSEALAVDTLIVNNLRIESLKGVEAFQNLVYLDCSRNNLDSLLIYNNQNLRFLHCSSNRINYLNLSQNTSLEDLNCWNNFLQKLNLDSNIMLRKLGFSSPFTDSLTLTNNQDLIWLNIGGESLEFLNIDSNTNLERIELYATKLDSLNFSNSPNLNLLRVNGDNYEYIDIGNNVDLTYLSISNTFIDSINLDALFNLTYVDVSSNDSLRFLSIKNGNNQNLIIFTSISNKNLYCIGADSLLSPKMNKDLWSEFSINCPSVNCKSYSYHILPLICLIEDDTTNTRYPVIDTLSNSLGCDSLLIIRYSDQIYDSSYEYDSIILVNTMGVLKPLLSYRIFYNGGFLSGPHITYLPTSKYEFQWYLNDSLIIGATDSVFMPLQSGYYKVELTLKDNFDLCKVFSFSYFIDIQTSVNEIKTSDIYVSPNPFKNHIVVNAPFSEKINIALFDVLGKTVLKKETITNKQIELSGLISGVYFLQISKNGNLIRNMKIIKN